MNAKGFDPVGLDKSSKKKAAIRGREQQLIDANGSAQSMGGTSGNAINGISLKNKNRKKYLNAANRECGMTGARRQRRRPGDFIRVELGGGQVAYGRVLVETVAFYDKAVEQAESPSVEESAKWRIAFQIWVVDYAITEGDWPVYGHLPLEPALEVEPEFYRVDAISGALTIMRDGGSVERPATKEECAELERAAVWEPEHVCDRLRDHFAGRPCKWVEPL